MIGRRNRSTRRKPAPVPLSPPQTPHAVRNRTRAAAVESQRLGTAILYSYFGCTADPAKHVSWNFRPLQFNRHNTFKITSFPFALRYSAKPNSTDET
jgi:hypothetical protein